MSPQIPLPHLHSGKVRDVYDAGDDRLLMVTSARISAFFSRCVLALAGGFGVCERLKMDVGLFGEFMTASPRRRMGETNCRWEFRRFS